MPAPCMLRGATGRVPNPEPGSRTRRRMREGMRVLFCVGGLREGDAGETPGRSEGGSSEDIWGASIPSRGNKEQKPGGRSMHGVAKHRGWGRVGR